MTGFFLEWLSVQMSNTSHHHVPVLLREVKARFVHAPEGLYLDGTFGRGGHSQAILDTLQPKGRLLALDQDPTAIAYAKTHMNDARFAIRQGNFEALHAHVMAEFGRDGVLDGILLDLGVSSPQLDTAERGFSFQQDGPLDMRMDVTQLETAASFLATVSEEDLVGVLKTYGEERFAKRIARAIVTARAQTPLTRTLQLAKIVADAHPAWERHKHPATRAFQAIRIAVNRELEVLDSVLSQTISCLKPGGQLWVMSFHSLEDRRVKQFMRRESQSVQPPKGVPVRAEALEKPALRCIGRAIRASSSDIADNPRARSVVLRIAEKV